MNGSTSTAETFRRVRDAYDLERMAASSVVYVGVGGAATFAEELARAGVGRHVLIDPDIVSETNLATQQVYRRDLGRPKVECVAERIRDINPLAEVVPLQVALDDLDDVGFWQLVGVTTTPTGSEQHRGVTILCGLTDSFPAQARVNRLALHFGLPSLCAQVYREGRGAEITFTYPGVTPACQRCILLSRYEMYLERGFRNDVGSGGSPIFATTRLNALKGFLALGLLHHGMERWVIPPGDGLQEIARPGYQRWGTLLERVGNRNLVQIRMDPDLAQTLGLTVFDRVFGNGDQDRILFDEVVWLPQQPENDPPCPDCGGTGDLREVLGTFADTRIMTPRITASSPEQPR